MTALDLESYRSLIALDQPWRPPDPIRHPLSTAERVRQLLLALQPGIGPWLASATPAQARQRLYALLIEAPADALAAEQLAQVDQLLAFESGQRPSIDPMALAPWPGRGDRSPVVLWQGDITTLACDAIVNAANASLLGCFRPNHPCIDNAIHAVAGPRLRADCQRIIEQQGHPEPTGVAKITRAYHLPSRYVVHTVGPMHRGHDCLAQESAQLAACYRACLDLVAELPSIRQLAFCCISTGVFGFPADLACRVAIDTVDLWLKHHPARLDRLVFNVFGDQDAQLYRAALGAAAP